MKHSYLGAAFAALTLAACGDSGGSAQGASGAAANGGGSGGVSVTITAMETESSNQGIVNNCIVSVEAHNGIGSPINLGMDLAATFDEADFISAAAGSAGNVTLYIGKMDRRERVEDSFTVRGSTCESVTSLSVATPRCSIDGGGGSCNDSLSFDGGGLVEIAS